MRADRLRELRLARGYTLEELAGLIEVNVRQVSRYESGESDPTSKIVARIAQTLGTTSDYLLGLSDDPGENYVDEPLNADERKLIVAIRAQNQREIFHSLAVLSEQSD